MERVLDDAADHLRRETSVGELNIAARALRWLCSYFFMPPAALTFWMYALVVLRGGRGAGAEEDRDEAAAGLAICVVQGRTSLEGLRVDRGAVSDEQY